MGHRNTRRKPQVQQFQVLRIIREHKSEEKASCLGKGELQTPKLGPLETYSQINQMTAGCCIDHLNRQRLPEKWSTT